MRAGSLVLLHSPLVGPVSWGQVPEVLLGGGAPVAVVSVMDDGSPPYAHRYVATAATQVAAADLVCPLVLVGHSGAGPLLPQVAAAARAGGRRVAGYAFLDAGIPSPGADRLTLLDTEDRRVADDLRGHLAAGGHFPQWSFDELAEEVPDPVARAELVASIRPRAEGFFTEPVPVPADWPDAPCGYLQLSSAYGASARRARARGWPVHKLELGHFGALNEPEEVAKALRSLIAEM